MQTGWHSSASGGSSRIGWAAAVATLVLCCAPVSAEQHEEPQEEKTAFEQLVWEIERAGRAAKPRRLERLLRDIDQVLAEPAPLEQTACWRILKATVEVELSRYSEARESFGILADTCPVWEVLNNLAVLEARAGDYGPARRRLLDCSSPSDRGCGAIAKANWDEKAVPRANLREIVSGSGLPALLLAGVPVECNAEPPIADCGAPVRTAVRQITEQEEEGARDEETTTTTESDRPPLGTVRIMVEPSDASVYLDGDLFGSAEEVARLAGGLRVVAGGHVIEAKRPGYATRRQEFDVETGAVVEIVLRLEELAGEVEPAADEIEDEELEEAGEPSAPRGPEDEQPGAVEGAAEEQGQAPGPEEAPATPEEPADPPAAVRAVIESWRQSWEQRQLEEYFAHYASPDVAPATRRSNILDKERIEVSIDDLQLLPAGANVRVATFTQTYCGYYPPDEERPPFGDRGPKELALRLTDGAWKIIDESDDPLPAHECR